MIYFFCIVISLSIGIVVGVTLESKYWLQHQDIPICVNGERYRVIKEQEFLDNYARKRLQVFAQQLEDTVEHDKR